MKSEAEALGALDRYADTVRRICFVHMKNPHEAQDVFQDVFLKYLLRDEPFESEEHERAWLIRVAVNRCKDVLRAFYRRNVVAGQEAAAPDEASVSAEHREVLDAVLRLPEKYRDVIYLFYYEGYSALEIAGILGRKANTVYTWLARAKEQLRAELGGDGLDG